MHCSGVCIIDFEQAHSGWVFFPQWKILVNAFILFKVDDTDLGKEYKWTLNFYKQPVYKQLALGWQIAKQLSGLTPYLLSNNEICRLKKVKFFFCNKRKMAVKVTIQQNSAISKSLLAKC